MVLLNKEQIKALIPHREPFLLIDEVTALTPGEQCTARTYIKQDDFWFPGHFPKYPVTPGVLLIEMLAQTGAVCVASKPEFADKIAFFSKIDKAKFRRQVVPGDVVELSVSLVRLRSKVGVGRAVATVDGKVAVSCDITFMFDDSRDIKETVEQMHEAHIIEPAVEPAVEPAEIIETAEATPTTETQTEETPQKAEEQ